METALFRILCIFSAVCITNNFTLSYSLCLEDQKNLLLEFKSGLEFDSSLSTKLVKWNESYKEECCSWGGVECDAQGHVISLQLDNETISGEINDSSILLSFRHLQKLNLAENDFGGSKIPSGIHNLTHLTHLNLSNAWFSGQVPLGLSSLTSLVSLDLSSQSEASRPMKFENPNLKMILHNLTGLRELYLDGVNISSNGSDWGYAISSSLPELQNLSLRYCKLSGPLHSSLVELHSLSLLRLNGNNLSTTIPNFFSNFSSLTTLTLSSCSLKGWFPMTIFQIPTLQYLDLSFNLELSGTLPQFVHRGSFRSIKIRSTNFSGPIPSFYMLKKLIYIDLSHNRFMGSVSSVNFEGNSNLIYLNFGYNLLNGSIPKSLFCIPSLETLVLSNNYFSGPMVEFCTPFSSNILILDLRQNRLEGSIPESFFKLEKLQELSISYNSFNGTVNFGKFQSLLSKLDMSYNNLSIDASSINSSMPIFSQMWFLRLASCNLYDFPNLRNQSYLEVLDLSNNHITGEIPSWIWTIGKIGGLFYLNVSSNLLTGMQKPYVIPELIDFLDLHSNQIRGQLPSAFPNAPYIDFSYNNFEGSLPHGFGEPNADSYFFSFANNKLSGAIPVSLCDAINLQVLDLSNNNFSGGIPPCLFQNLDQSLGVLNLGRNSISGHIPNTFTDECRLRTLDIATNDIGGSIPPSLASCKLLEIMNVGNNKIEDNFPCMMPSSLRILLLRSNKFHGEVRCNESWPNLQILDIASNNFSGYLYSINFSSWRGMVDNNDASQLRFNHSYYVTSNELDSSFHPYYQDTVTLTFKASEFKLPKILTTFTSLDFSCNHFQGQIPDTIIGLKSLYVLNLSHNALTGAIPKSFSNLIQLESLDLSMNSLTGEIPRGLAALKFLSVLNLSYNKLTGEIPQGHQFQTFSVSSFQGNTRLCGFPLDRRCSQPNENVASGHGEELNKKGEIKWEYVSVALGFGVGFGSIVWLLFGFERISSIFSKKADEIFEYIFGVRQQSRRMAQRRGVQRTQERRQ